MQKKITTFQWSIIYLQLGNFYMQENDILTMLHYGRILGIESFLSLSGYDTSHLWSIILNLNI